MRLLASVADAGVRAGSRVEHTCSFPNATRDPEKVIAPMTAAAQSAEICSVVEGSVAPAAARCGICKGMGTRVRSKRPMRNTQSSKPHLRGVRAGGRQNRRRAYERVESGHELWELRDLHLVGDASPEGSAEAQDNGHLCGEAGGGGV